jgi:hypothetical protein
MGMPIRYISAFDQFAFRLGNSILYAVTVLMYSIDHSAKNGFIELR